MTEIRTISGGPPIPSPTLVQADQLTILGDGSHERPLHVTSEPSSGVTFRAAFRTGSTAPGTGIPVFISFVQQAGGITTVQVSNARNESPFFSTFDSFASAWGVVKSVNGDGTVQVMQNGLLTLSTGRWDALTGLSGGLSQGSAYYVSTDISGGILITPTPSKAPGDFVTRIGVGVNSTTMLVEPSPPVQNLKDQIVFVAFAGQPLIIGTTVYVTSNNHVQAASSDISVTVAQAIGIIAAFDINSAPIVQIAGVITLTTAQWDAVTDTSPGVQPGTAYYVDTNANVGHLTATPPVTGARVQVCVGLNATQMVLSTPYLQRLT